MKLGASKNKWITEFSNFTDQSLTMFCFPYAGGSAQVFKPWADQLPSKVHLSAIQLPGRASRFVEEPYTRLTPLVSDLADQIRPFLDRPFVFFGHSLGAAISFELARLLQPEGLRPQYLFVSGRNAPKHPRKRPPIHHLPEQEFKAELLQMNGTPTEILEHQELMDLMLPMLRADFAVSETYSYEDGTDLTCPMAAFGGVDDPDVDEEGVRGWGKYSQGSFQHHMLPGDHFFIHQSKSILLNQITEYLDQGQA